MEAEQTHLYAVARRWSRLYPPLILAVVLCGACAGAEAATKETR